MSLLSVVQSNSFLDLLSQPWHWSISGVLLAVVMFLLLWFGGEFGVSGNFRTVCSILTGGKNCDFFDFNWRNQIWNLVFIGGAVVGGFLATHFLASPEPVQVSTSTVEYLSSVGIDTPMTLAEGTGYVPKELFATEQLLNLKNILFLIVGGFLVGFGTRWAGGSAHLVMPSVA